MARLKGRTIAKSAAARAPRPLRAAIAARPAPPDRSHMDETARGLGNGAASRRVVQERGCGRAATARRHDLPSPDRKDDGLDALSTGPGAGPAAGQFAFAPCDRIEDVTRVRSKTGGDVLQPMRLGVPDRAYPFASIRIAPKQLPVPAPCQMLGVAYEPADTRSQRIGRTIPLDRDTIGAKKNDADLTVRRPFAQRILDAQQQEPARHARLDGIECGAQAAVRQEVEEAVERTEWTARRGNALDVEERAQWRRHGETALDDIEADPAQAVGKKQRLTSPQTLPDGQKIRPCGRIDGITIALSCR